MSKSSSRFKAAFVTASADVRVPFNDVDMMRVAWHGNYMKYIEDGRCALLDKISYNYPEMEASGMMWPIVDTRIKYVRSATFNQLLRVHAGLVEYENRIKIEYRIEDAETEELLTKAYSIQVAVDAKTQEMQFCSPPLLLKNVSDYLASTHKTAEEQ
ncbi:MAG: acyl-CoA thioesterase [Sinobacterium sp.]|nr:acyl-CoA thioesterase [Sinobacterium sp.]